MKTLLTACLVFLAACSAASESPCNGSKNELACESCITHPPRGNAGVMICDGEQGWTCCAVTQANGSADITFALGSETISVHQE